MDNLDKNWHRSVNNNEHLTITTEKYWNSLKFYYGVVDDDSIKSKFDSPGSNARASKKD